MKKKVLMIICAAALVFSLAACTNDNNPDETSDTASDKTTLAESPQDTSAETETGETQQGSNATTLQGASSQTTSHSAVTASGDNSTTAESGTTAQSQLNTLEAAERTAFITIAKNTVSEYLNNPVGAEFPKSTSWEIEFDGDVVYLKSYIELTSNAYQNFVIRINYTSRNVIYLDIGGKIYIQ